MKWLSVLMLFSLIACEGPTGPPGPAGAPGQKGDPGEQGPPGPGTRVTYQGRLDANGEAIVALPAEAGSLDNPPVVSCYMSDVVDGPYLVVANDISLDPSTNEFAFNTVCLLGHFNLATRLEVGLIGPANWYYRVSAVY